MTTKYVHFTIHGDALTDLVRERVADGNWPEALQALRVSLPELSTDQAIAVLQGRQRFEGINTLNLVDEDRDITEYERDLALLYAGTYRDASQQLYLRPYAVVTSWSANDLGGPGSSLNRWLPIRPNWPGMYSGFAAGDMSEWRSLAYADDRVNDRPYSSRNHPGVILFCQAAMPPLWIQPARSLDQALEAYLAAGCHLEERGGHLPRFERSVEDVPTDEELEEPVVRTPPDLPVLPGISPGAQRSILDAMTGRQDTTSKPTPDPTFHHAHGWVSLDGQFYGCEFHEHTALAQRLLVHVVGLKAKQADKDPEKQLEALRWMKISTSQLTRLISIVVCGKATPRQRKTAELWSEKHGKGEIQEFD